MGKFRDFSQCAIVGIVMTILEYVLQTTSLSLHLANHVLGRSSKIPRHLTPSKTMPTVKLRQWLRI